MDLIPVIDLMQGQVVRGVAGERHLYRPFDSTLSGSADPVKTYQALTHGFQPGWIYVADLDGILHGEVQVDVLRELATGPIPLAVDAGVHTAQDIGALLELGVGAVILGLESLDELKLVAASVADFGPERIIFSLDLKEGRTIGPAAAGATALSVVATVRKFGVKRLIVLDLASVGLGRGVPTRALCRQIKTRWPDLTVWTGGGVRSMADVHAVGRDRGDGVLAASALHDGRITPAQWQMFQRMSDDETLLAMDG